MGLGAIIGALLAYVVLEIADREKDRRLSKQPKPAARRQYFQEEVALLADEINDQHELEHGHRLPSWVARQRAEMQIVEGSGNGSK